jgi:hypothetical protein
MATVVINLEKGMPKTEAALAKLKLELATLRRIGVQAVKVIHGYGSTGTGGAIRQATRQYLCDQLKNKLIKAYCPGENFGPFENAGASWSTWFPPCTRIRTGAARTTGSRCCAALIQAILHSLTRNNPEHTIAC